MWGRSFRANGKQASPQLATCFVAIQKDKMETATQESGFSRVYITPAEEGDFKPDLTYLLTWTRAASRPEVEAILVPVAGHLGYIQGRNGFAIRTLYSQAAAVWKLCRPDGSQLSLCTDTTCQVYHRPTTAPCLKRFLTRWNGRRALLRELVAVSGMLLRRPP